MDTRCVENCVSVIRKREIGEARLHCAEASNKGRCHKFLRDADVGDGHVLSQADKLLNVSHRIIIKISHILFPNGPSESLRVSVCLGMMRPGPIRHHTVIGDHDIILSMSHPILNVHPACCHSLPSNSNITRVPTSWLAEAWLSNKSRRPMICQ